MVFCSGVRSGIWLVGQVGVGEGKGVQLVNSSGYMCVLNLHELLYGLG